MDEEYLKSLFLLKKSNKIKIKVSFRGTVLINTIQNGFSTMHGILKYIYEQLPDYKKKKVRIELKNLETSHFIIAEHRIREKYIPNSI